MQLPFRLLLATAGILPLQPGGLAIADGQSREEEIPLSEQDLRNITSQVLASEPLLSSSPGIKYAGADRFDESEDIAVVIFYPHQESGGIKEAFQVECLRYAPANEWACQAPEIRRYLSLDSQDYEVRVTGPISSDAAIAFLEASRKVLPVSKNEADDVPDTAMMLGSYDDRAYVSWVNFEGRAHQMVKGRVSEGGNPALEEDWVIERADLESPR